MSYLTYSPSVTVSNRPLVWLSGEVKTPPFTRDGRIAAGILLRRLQRGESVGMPHVRPMPSIGAGCHELRLRDHNITWRIIVRVDTDAIVIAAVFAKKTQKTPSNVISASKRRLAVYDRVRSQE